LAAESDATRARNLVLLGKDATWMDYPARCG
jgi:hypothetical protein